MGIRRLIVVLILIFPAWAFADYPKPSEEYVNDFARIIDAETADRLRKRLHDIEYHTGVEIVVATIEDYQRYETGDATWEAFATGLFNRWGIGD